MKHGGGWEPAPFAGCVSESCHQEVDLYFIDGDSDKEKVEPTSPGVTPGGETREDDDDQPQVRLIMLQQVPI